MIRRRLAQIALGLIPLSAVAAPLAWSRAAMAATITTDTFDDVASPDCTVAGHCSLRATILSANATPGTTIQLQAGTYKVSIPIASSQSADDGKTGDLEIASPTTIKGAGVDQTIIKGDTAFNERIMEVDQVTVNGGPTSLNISDLTITGGKDTGIQESEGGGLSVDGLRTVNVNNVLFINNSSSSDGGGLASDDGNLTVTNSTFDTNTALSGGAISLFGNNTQPVMLSKIFITGNTATSANAGDSGGGGIYNGLEVSSKGLVVTDAMIVNNHATGMRGGGIYDDHANTTSPTIYQDITLANNTARAQGGGMYLNTGSASVINATITGNNATGTETTSTGFGGGIAIGLPSGQLTVNNATINANKALRGGAGIYSQGGDTLTFHNSIITNNTVGLNKVNCTTFSPANLVSTGYNIEDDVSCDPIATDRDGSALNPNLGPLQDNTGPTDGAAGHTSPCLTEALPAGSIAVDTADPNGAHNPATDERHVTRPQGAFSDVGAYELIQTPVQVTLPKAGQRSTSGPLAPALLALLALAIGSAVWAGAIPAAGRLRAWSR